MLTKERQRRGLRALATSLALAVTVALPAGVTLAMDAGSADVEPVEPELGAAATLDELRVMVDDLALANDTLTSDNTSLRQDLATLSAERDQLRASLGRFDDLYDPMEADRQLLLELRKDLPETRPEAEAQLARIRALALASDPARLGRLVDRVDDTAPAFLDWRFGAIADPQALSTAYVETGANAFDQAMAEFRSEALMSVSNRIDGLLTILDRVR